MLYSIINMSSSGHSFKLDIFFGGKFYLDTCFGPILDVDVMFQD